MPVSASIFDRVVLAMIKLCKPSVVVDIGPGMGKYGRMLRQIEHDMNWEIQKICVEVDKEKVIERFELHHIYDEIIHEDASALAKRWPSLSGDLVVAGDVIEHLTKSEGIDLIEYLQYRFKRIFLVIPMDWLSFSYEDYEHESHISLWRQRDIDYFTGGYCVERRMASGERFLLAAVNGITVPVIDHFVVRDACGAGQPLLGDADIEFGYLNR